MRRVLLLFSAVFATAVLSAFAALAVQAQASDQYEGSEGTDAGQAEEQPAAGGSPSGGLPADVDEDVVSQGSVGGEAPTPEAASRAAADLAEEERLPDYSQIVDNTTKGRFSATGSKVVSDPTAHNGSYAALSGKPAAFKVKVPTASDYSLYAWWPASARGAGSASYAVSGQEEAAPVKVNQARDGGMWIRLGTFRLAPGERTVTLSGKGAAADAVALVRGEVAAPPEDSYSTVAPAAGRSSASKVTAERRGAGGRRAVVRDARRWLGTPYRYATCSRRTMSCTCLTMRAWRPNGHSIGLTENGQWRYEPSRKIPKSRLSPGDIVFFKEGGSRYITHVGIYSGRGNIIHASAYYRYKKVVESKMRYISGYFGASRLRSR